MLARVPRLDEIRAALGAHRPRLLAPGGGGRAAVALVLRPDAGGRPELLFIERARHPADPWSGHMAFPGGRVDPGDAGPRGAAERETLEEVGLPIAAAERVGRLDDLEGRRAGREDGLVISGFVYFLERPGPVRPNYEVAEAFWVPLAKLLDPERGTFYAHPIAAERRFPGILVGRPERHVVWGLTYRFLQDFFGILGCTLPAARARSECPGARG